MDETALKKLRKLKAFLDNKDLAQFEELSAIAEALNSIKGISFADVSQAINTLVENVKVLKGDKGVKGEIGPQGPQGDKGESIIGLRGLEGPRGPVGPSGRDGESIRGPMGPKGDKGDSIAGKDAIINEDEIVKKVLKQIPEPKVGFMPPIPPPPLKIKGAGTQIADAIREINFAGAGVSVTRASAEKVLVTIAGGAGNFAENEVVAGDVQTFTLANTPTLGSERIYANGQRLTPTIDYTISGAVVSTVNSWSAGTVLADYRY